MVNASPWVYSVSGGVPAWTYPRSSSNSPGVYYVYLGNAQVGDNGNSRDIRQLTVDLDERARPLPPTALLLRSVHELAQLLGQLRMAHARLGRGDLHGHGSEARVVSLDVGAKEGLHLLGGGHGSLAG